MMPTLHLQQTPNALFVSIGIHAGTPFTYRVPVEVNWVHPTVFRLNTSTWESAHACAVIAEQYSGYVIKRSAQAR
nr:hypothetical protein [Tanacetum cinerariifolium]